MVNSRQVRMICLVFGVTAFYIGFYYPIIPRKRKAVEVSIPKIQNVTSTVLAIGTDKVVSISSSIGTEACVCNADDVSVQIFLGYNSTKVACPISVNVIGRLGNVMGQYATLLALSRLNGRPAYQQESMHGHLKEYFDLSMPIVKKNISEKIKWINTWVHDWMSDEYVNLKCEFTFITGYPCSWTFFHRIADVIKSEFTFKSDIIQSAQSQLRIYATNRTSVTFIGLHVRRGDYVKLMQVLYNGVLADAEYFDKATNYFRDKYPGSVFVVCSDDLNWCKRNINSSRGDVYFGWNGTSSTAGRDMALLVQCNHTIMSMGTFGFWSAYLTGGDVVYLNNYTRPGSKFHDVFHYDAAYLPEWHGINANLNSTTWL